MTWFKVDDQLPQCAKLDELIDDPRLLADAMLVWLFAGCYSAGALTDGVISHSRVKRLTPLAPRQAKAAAAALVRSGLWDEHADGYVFHNWGLWQPSAEAIEEQRRTHADRQRRYRERSKHEAVTRDTGVTRHASVTANARVPHGDVTVTHTRPDPTRPYKEIDHAREISPTASLGAQDLERLGAQRYGLLGGRSIQAIRALVPITGQEWLDASRTAGTSWAYFAKVIASMREEAASPRPASRTRTDDEPGWMRATRKIIEEDRNAQQQRAHSGLPVDAAGLLPEPPNGGG
jgi:hypothetical protein